MDFNTLLARFGFDSSNFVNKELVPIEFEGGVIYEVEEIYRQRICPYCNNQVLHIHNRRWLEIKLTSTIGVKEYLRIKRIRYKCPNCGKTHTFELVGIDRNKTISEFVITAIRKEFFEIQSFTTIAKRYDISVMKVINIFDKYTKIVPRRPLPKYLCIDEKHFISDNGKYAVVISDFFSGEIIDVIINRQLPYLNEYFSSITSKERENVKVFISDMYDNYSTVKNKYFANALFVVDLFHVIKLLTTAVNQLRIKTYNQCSQENTVEKQFMKTNWRYFLMDESKIYKNEYYSKKFNVYIPYGEIVLRCLKKNKDFWDGYNVMQELLHYDKYDSYKEAENFMDRIIAKLISTGNELLCKVADSYKKWKPGIINGLSKKQSGKRFSNSIAESNNSHIQRVINVAYGYKNFARFRARIMLLMTYKK